MAPQITLYFLQASRCIRTAWLLEELGLEYEVKFADRESGKAPEWMKKEAGGLGKFPTLKDGDLILYESGNIAEYLCDTYDKQHRLLPPIGDPERYKVLQWVHAAEATYALHALAILYCRWFQKDGNVATTEEGASGNVQKDLDFFETTMQHNKGKFIFGDKVTVADTMLEFTLDFVLARELGTKGRRWERVEQYIKDCHETSTWQKAQQKTNHKM